MIRKIRNFFRRKPTVSIPEDPLKAKFANFFAEYAQNSLPDQGYEMIGWIENDRVEMYQNPRYFNYKEKLGFETTFCKIFQLYNRSQADALLMYCESGNEILWLDNHLNNRDFDRFIQREGLLNLLPNEVTQFATFFTELKLSYLGKPKLVSNVAQVARSKERYEQIWSSEECRQTLLEEDKQLEELADRIVPPSCSSTNEGFWLPFFVWTKIIGRVIHVECEISNTGTIQYTLTELTSGLGDYFVPR